MKQLPKPLSEPTDNHLKLPDEESRVPPAPKFSFKKLAYVVGGIAAAAIAVWVLRPAPVKVDMASIQRGNLQVTVDAEGKTRVRDRFIISADIDGQLNRIPLDEGDPVRKGMVVAQIDPLPLNATVKEALGRLAEWKAERAGVETQRPKAATVEQARIRIQLAETRLQQAKARVMQAKASLEQAKRDRQRAERLESTGAIARQNRESAQLDEITKAKELEAAMLAVKAEASEVEVAKAALAVVQKEQTDPDYLLKVYNARIASTEAELTKLKDEARRTEIRSPSDGKVLRIHQKSAQFVSSGAPLLEIGDAKKLELVIDVLSSDAMKIKPGNPILIEPSFSSNPIQAKVRLVEPSAFTKVSALGIEEQRVNIIGDFISSAESFGDAYRVDARIIIWKNNDVLKVPVSSLFRCHQANWCVFVVEHSKAYKRQVAIGQRNELEAEVKQGLKQGETVILHPTGQVKEGVRVQPRQ